MKGAKAAVAAAVKPHIPIDRTMILLAFVFAAAWTVTGAMAAHLPRILEAAGATTLQAVVAGALIGPAQVVARIVEASFLSRYHPLLSTRLACLTHPIGAAIVALAGGGAASVFAIFHGAGNGILTIARGTLPLAIFGPQNYGYRLGIIGAPARMAQAAAPLVFGLLIDTMGSRVLIVSSALSLVGAAGAVPAAQASRRRHDVKRRETFALPIPRRFEQNHGMEKQTEPAAAIRGLCGGRSRRRNPMRSISSVFSWWSGLSFYVGTLKPKKAVGIGPPPMSAPSRATETSSDNQRHEDCRHDTRGNACDPSASIRPNSARRPATPRSSRSAPAASSSSPARPPLDRDGNVVGKSDFAAQAAQVFCNLAIALTASGCTAANLVKLTVFLTDMDNLGSYREARNRFFASVTPPAAPAVTLVEVSKLYGPDFMIEIEAIAAA